MYWRFDEIPAPKIAKPTLIGLVAVIVFVFSATGQGIYERRKIEEKWLKSTVLAGENRPILISKPTGYANSKDRYFVIYVLDGNFNTSFTMGIAELLYQSGYPKVLIVGIPSTYRDRDLSPTRGKDKNHVGGGADKFLEFIKTELIPHINSKYRTYDFKVLVGHSLGGLFAVHTLYADQDLFDGYIAITPTVVHDDFDSGKKLQGFLRKSKKIKSAFFFSVAHEPGGEGDAVFKLHKIFEKEAPKDFSWKFNYYPKENHSTTPLIATLDGLRFVFGDLVANENLVKQRGLTYLIDYYKKLEEKYKAPIKIPQRILINYGYDLIKEGRDTEAIEVFKLYARIHPKIPEPYEALSRLYLKDGRKIEAINILEELLKIHPNYGAAVKQLKELRGIK